MQYKHAMHDVIMTIFIRNSNAMTKKLEASGDRTKHDPRNNDQRNTKKVKQKDKGKSQRLKMGLELNHGRKPC